jgi:NAD(P)-dependent dehydrogenase (short-subunit alcohol dehydrogenase family)
VTARRRTGRNAPAPARNSSTRRPRSAAKPDLHGRVALVTGAGRGIGRATALELAAAGASVVLTARTRREIDAAAGAITQRGGVALAIACDVRDAAQVHDTVSAAVRHFRRLDILVNNAGAFQIALIEATDEKLWDTILDTNLKGAYLMTRAAVPHLVRHRGHLLNVVSMAGRKSWPGNSAYSASKWGLLGFTNVLRTELGPRGVRVTALLPGAVDTPIWDPIPGTWNRARMLRPETVAQAIVDVCKLPPEACGEEVVIVPTGGE